MLRLLAAAVLTAVVVGMPSAAFAAELDFRIADDRITESSGLALSVRHPHTVWTVNDSGDRARVFAVDTRTGRTVGVHTFDAPVWDVEALAVTRHGRMLVADIGDNTSSRDSVRVHAFDEPELGMTSGPATSWELAYPDGPHDAESLAADPATGRIVIVTKDEVGGVYAVPAQIGPSRPVRLTKVAAAPGGVTDGVFLADGSTLVLRTYTSLLLLDPSTWQVSDRRTLPLQPQGETLALAPSRGGLLIGSEGRRSRVQQVELAATSSPIPVPSPTPTRLTSSATTAQRGASISSQASPHDRGVDANPGQLLLGIGGTALLLALAVLLTWAARRSRR